MMNVIKEFVWKNFQSTLNQTFLLFLTTRSVNLSLQSSFLFNLCLFKLTSCQKADRQQLVMGDFRKSHCRWVLERLNTMNCVWLTPSLPAYSHKGAWAAADRRPRFRSVSTDIRCWGQHWYADSSSGVKWVHIALGYSCLHIRSRPKHERIRLISPHQESASGT